MDTLYKQDGEWTWLQEPRQLQLLTKGPRSLLICTGNKQYQSDKLSFACYVHCDNIQCFLNSTVLWNMTPCRLTCTGKVSGQPAVSTFRVEGYLHGSDCRLRRYTVWTGSDQIFGANCCLHLQGTRVFTDVNMNITVVLNVTPCGPVHSG
jgi:hypothetical protein